METSAGKSIRGVLTGLLTLAVMCTPAFAGNTTGKKKAASDAPKPTVPVYTGWNCAFCAFRYGWHGATTLGLENLSQGSYKFGEYSGLVRSGLYLDAGFHFRYLDKKGDYLDANGSRLGFDSRRLSVRGGRQGIYEITALYQGIPHYYYQSALTPFKNPGSGFLKLPANWTASGSTGAMPGLRGSLHTFDIEKKRTIERIGVKLPPRKTHWSYAVGFQHETQRGTDVIAGSFLTTSTLLPEPIDYATDQVNASANYILNTWQMKFAYYGSFFHDNNTYLRWQNPFTPYVPGADVGQLGQLPGNSFNQLSMAGAWELPARTRVMTMLAYGRGVQDDPFLQLTINPDLHPGALPRASLDGVVITRNYVLRLNSTPVARLELTANYTFDRHQDLTPRALFPQVLTDAYVIGSLMNNPYGFEKRSTTVEASYRFDHGIHLSVGGEHRNESQTFENSVDTRTNSVWIASRVRPMAQFAMRVKLLSARRVAPNYLSLADLLLPENPLLRQYNIGDRKRTQDEVTVSYRPLSYLDLSLQWQQNVDRYEATLIGLTASRDTNYTFNLGLQPTQHLSLSAYYTEERIVNDQAGSQDTATADWYGDRQDIVHSAGLDAEWKQLGGTPWGIGLSFLYQLARGEIAIVRSNIASPFPDIVERTQGLQVYARRALNDHLGLRFSYGFQRYRSNDWMLDNVGPATIPNVLTLGIQSPDYTINVLAVSARYVF